MLRALLSDSNEGEVSVSTGFFPATLEIERKVHLIRNKKIKEHQNIDIPALGCEYKPSKPLNGSQHLNFVHIVRIKNMRTMCNR